MGFNIWQRCRMKSGKKVVVCTRTRILYSLLLSPENCPKSHNFSTKTFLCQKNLQYLSAVTFVLTLWSKLPHILEKLLFNCCTFDKLTKSILFDYSGVRFASPPLFSKQAKLSKWPKKPGN